jgi:hypothetical protein
VQRRHVVGRGEQADDDLLAVQRRQGRDAGLDGHAVDGELGAAVLRARRSAMSRPDTILMRLTVAAVALRGHRHDVTEHAVDAVADAQLAGLRLDVHVAGPGAHGVGEDDVDQADDRGGLDALGREVLDLLLAGVDALEQRVHVRGVLGQAPRAGQVVAHLAVRRDQHDELGGAGVELDVVERDDVGGVGGGDRDAAALALEHEDAGALGDGAREELDRVGLGHDPAEVDEREVEGRREGLRHLALGREAGLDDDGAEALALLAGRRRRLQREDLPELLLADDALLDQHLTQATTTVAGRRVAARLRRNVSGHETCIGRDVPKV